MATRLGATASGDWTANHNHHPSSLPRPLPIVGLLPCTSPPHLLATTATRYVPRSTYSLARRHLLTSGQPAHTSSHCHHRLRPTISDLRRPLPANTLTSLTSEPSHNTHCPFLGHYQLLLELIGMEEPNPTSGNPFDTTPAIFHTVEPLPPSPLSMHAPKCIDPI